MGWADLHHPCAHAHPLTANAINTLYTVCTYFTFQPPSSSHHTIYMSSCVCTTSPTPLFPLPLFFQSKFIVHCCTPFQCKSLTIFPFTSVHFIKWDMGIQDKTFSNRPMVQSHEIRLLFAKLG